MAKYRIREIDYRGTKTYVVERLVLWIFWYNPYSYFDEFGGSWGEFVTIGDAMEGLSRLKAKTITKTIIKE
jgi:hypothetical protein